MKGGYDLFVSQGEEVGVGRNDGLKEKHPLSGPYVGVRWVVGETVGNTGSPDAQGDKRRRCC
jgi:hypothetical protein